MTNQEQRTKNQELPKPRAKHQVPKRPLLRHAVVVSGLLLAFVGTIGWQLEFQWTTLEKVAQQLMAPAGAIWALMVVATYAAWSWSRRGEAIAISCVLLLYTLGGSEMIGQALIATLEHDYPPVNIDKLPTLDYVAVLGGGATTRPEGNHELVESGDRIHTAAACFHAGKCHWLITTGSDLGIKRSTTDPSTHSPSKDEMNPADAGAEILEELGCDPQRIIKLTGRNTSEEMTSIAEFMRSKPDATLGIVTSAWHMRRAARLAAHRGLKFIPIPCHHEAAGQGSYTMFPIPNYHGFRKNDWVVKEYLAAWLGR